MDDVRLGLRHTGGNVPTHPDDATQFSRSTLQRGVELLEVIDQLRKGPSMEIYIVVRRRKKISVTPLWNGETGNQVSAPSIDGQLAALAGLAPWATLDLSSIRTGLGIRGHTDDPRPQPA